MTIRTDSLDVLDLRPDDHLKLTHRLADVLRTARRDQGDAVTIHGVVEGFGVRRAEKDVSPAGLAEAHRIVCRGVKTLLHDQTQTPKLNCAFSDPDRHVRVHEYAVRRPRLARAALRPPGGLSANCVLAGPLDQAWPHTCKGHQ